MSIKDIKNNNLEKVSGGAMPGKSPGKYIFYRSRCGRKWFGNDDPKDVP